MTVFRQRESINVSHVIHSVSFGEPYRGMVNPLDNQPKIIHEGSGYFQYYIKVHTYYTLTTALTTLTPTTSPSPPHPYHAALTTPAPPPGRAHHLRVRWAPTAANQPVLVHRTLPCAARARHCLLYLLY